MPETKLTNMCMVYNEAENKVLVQEGKKSWVGIAFSPLRSSVSVRQQVVKDWGRE